MEESHISLQEHHLCIFHTIFAEILTFNCRQICHFNFKKKKQLRLTQSETIGEEKQIPGKITTCNNI